MSAETLTRIAAAMGCAPADDDDLVEAVRLLVAERDDAARREALAVAECARLRVDLEATERARQAAEEERDAVLELVADDAVEAARQRDDRDAARLHAVATLRVALADADLLLEQRERQLREERARCASVCREVAAFYDPGDVGSEAARACADEIEREL